ncbi:MAG: hypothetical protein ABIJ09_19630 [Pseudomonadota bacterium]
MRPRSALVVSALVSALVLGAGCAHTTSIHSQPEGAQVFIDDDKEAAGTTPYVLSRGAGRVRVVQQEQQLEVELLRHTDWGHTALHTATACLLSALCLTGVGGGLWVLGAGLAAAAPVLGPIIAICGAPPAALGQALWTVVGSALCGAVALPLSTLMTTVGPDELHVDLERGTARTVPPDQCRVKAPLGEDPSSLPAAGSSRPADAVTHSPATDSGELQAEPVTRPAVDF